MDFVGDALFDGRHFRLLPVLDHFTHECLEIVVDQSLRADDVAEAVARLVAQRGRPEAIKVDNGSEFAGGLPLEATIFYTRIFLTEGGCTKRQPIGQ